MQEKTTTTGEFAQPRRERRAHVRVGIRVRVRMAGASGLTLSGWARNIGKGGVFVETDDYFPTGSECIVTIPIREGDTLHQLSATGEVRHHGPTGMGIRFTGITDEHLDVIGRLVSGEIPGAEPETR
ncbi:MAG: PilZ domain-containing protein [Nitrospirota bacterium]|nr:PilZ domain-containing protein [Nitrospirota bacterium]